MTASQVQILYWRDIPAQIKARRGAQRVALPLSDRFQEAIDAAAMQAGATSDADYLDAWRASAWREGPGDPQTLAQETAQAIEREFPPQRLRALVKNGGFEEPRSPIG
jgi:hypothetical protein